MQVKTCHCGSDVDYQNCCKQYHLGVKKPETAEALMRSRFVAFKLNLESYLLESWCQTQRPNQLNLQADAIAWQKLVIHSTKKGQVSDKEGWVTFSAFYQDGLDQGFLKEKSYFKRGEDGNWYYLSGEIINT
jgi:SEC-C motif-containing protein